ncbi:unnamed protein product, partial [Rangifer tarandus platyrhynchus]
MVTKMARNPNAMTGKALGIKAKTLGNRTGLCVSEVTSAVSWAAAFACSRCNLFKQCSWGQQRFGYKSVGWRENQTLQYIWALHGPVVPHHLLALSQECARQRLAPYRESTGSSKLPPTRAGEEIIRRQVTVLLGREEEAVKCEERTKGYVNVVCQTADSGKPRGRRGRNLVDADSKGRGGAWGRGLRAACVRVLEAPPPLLSRPLPPPSPRRAGAGATAERREEEEEEVEEVPDRG